MPQIPTRVRTSLACAAVVVSLAACGAPEPTTAAPDAGPDLFAALQTPTSTPPATPPPTVAPATSKPTATPKATTTATATATKAKSTAKAKARGRSRGSVPATSVKPVALVEPAPAPAVDWRPVAGDEFDGAALDADSWVSYNSKGGFGTGLRRPEAISQTDGKLRITARGDVSGGVGHTHGQLYGRWEFRARTDPGRGFGSAVLLWPDSEQWPRDGEVDIMEVPGENRDLAHFVLHWDEANHVHGTGLPGDYTQWHTFAVEWLPDRITWYVDGVKQYENTDKVTIPTTPMHLTAQLDQGPWDNWIPARDETTPEEVSLEVDWVRVYAAP